MLRILLVEISYYFIMLSFNTELKKIEPKKTCKVLPCTLLSVPHPSTKIKENIKIRSTITSMTQSSTLQKPYIHTIKEHIIHMLLPCQKNFHVLKQDIIKNFTIPSNINRHTGITSQNNLYIYKRISIFNKLITHIRLLQNTEQEICSYVICHYIEDKDVITDEQKEKCIKEQKGNHKLIELLRDETHSLFVQMLDTLLLTVKFVLNTYQFIKIFPKVLLLENTPQTVDNIREHHEITANLTPIQQLQCLVEYTFRDAHYLYGSITDYHVNGFNNPIQPSHHGK